MNLPPHLSVRNGHLFIGGHDTVALAAEYGTPLYVTDEERVRARYREYRDALEAHYDRVQVLYAAKANGNLALLRILASEGAGADVFCAGRDARSPSRPAWTRPASSSTAPRSRAPTSVSRPGTASGSRSTRSTSSGPSTRSPARSE